MSTARRNNCEILRFEQKLADALNQLVENSSLAADLKPYQLVHERHGGLQTMLCLCRSDLEILGGASFAVSEYEGEKVLEILTLFVDEHHRRRAFGERLIREMEEYAKRNNVKSLYGITDRRFRGAPELYRKCGFRVELEETYIVLKKEFRT